MDYAFDRKIDRKGTSALVLDGFQKYLFGAEGAVSVGDDPIYMWVADMQFAVPQVALEAISRRLEHPILGYTVNADGALIDAYQAWCNDRYGWQVNRDHIEMSLGVIPALYMLAECICAPGEAILTLTPSYGFFKQAAEKQGRTLITSDLRRSGADYTLDFTDFEHKTRDPAVKAFFLCHPHNPTGRIWEEGELRRLGEICFANEVKIVSDEIHCDLLRTGENHVPMQKLFPGSDRIVTCMSPGKTFNMAGMMTAIITIPDPCLRAKWQDRHYPFVNPLGLAATTGAYRDGADWLDALRLYLDGNFDLLKQSLEERLPRAVFAVPGATYLAWVDLGAYFPTSVNLTRFFIEKAGLVLEGGEMFVANADGMVRLNLACPRSELQRAIDRMCVAIDRQPKA